MNEHEYALIAQMARQRGGQVLTDDGVCHVLGKNQNELLHDVIDLLTEIRDLLRARQT